MRPEWPLASRRRSARQPSRGSGRRAAPAPLAPPRRVARRLGPAPPRAAPAARAAGCGLIATAGPTREAGDRHPDPVAGLNNLAFSDDELDAIDRYATDADVNPRAASSRD